MKELDKSLLNVVFKKRCIRCKGFVFLIHAEEIAKDKVKGTILCPDCNIKNTTHIDLTVKKATIH